MFKWIKKLRCERSVKYYYAWEKTFGRPYQGKYYIRDKEGYQWENTCVVYALFTNTHEKKEVQEFFGTNSSYFAEELVKKLNNL